ncbi:MAG: hypothetical protein HY704_11390 [Gemmatimonadetes bacterium]|nr:hypothetical protein [Gemmatimonadota bacterium]
MTAFSPSDLSGRRLARRVASWGALPLVAVLVPRTVSAQYSEPPPPAAYALKGVTVVHADGRTVTGVNAVIRGALVEAMGPNVAIPGDAKVLEGDSLRVYPGLVDAEGAAVFKFPDDQTDRRGVRSWDPPRTLQGFTPHRRVAEYLTAKGSDLKEPRMKGVVAAGVHAGDGLASGRGALLVFRKSAPEPRQLVANPDLGLTMSLRGARGVYPSTLFGVIAFHRQAFEDARRDGQILAEHTRDTRGLATPEWDPDRVVLRDVLAGRETVYFHADNAGDIRRVLDLSAEYGFRPVIMGGDGAWKVADLLKARDVPVLVSLDFPKPERWKPETKGEKEKTPPDTAGMKPAGEARQEKPLDAAALREKQEIEEIYANAGRLAAAGVRFALTSGGGKADLREGGRKAIEYGLTEADALRAVTSAPAATLGAPYLVRIEAGLPATFVITNGPLFGEKTQILYTFVEGELEKGKEPPKREAGEAGAVSVAGEWEVEVNAEDETIQFRMTLRQEKGQSSFEGTGSGDAGELAIHDGRVSGRTVELSITVSAGPETFEATAAGTVEGDRITGTGRAPDGEFTWTARRVSPPGEGWRP